MIQDDAKIKLLQESKYMIGEIVMFQHQENNKAIVEVGRIESMKAVHNYTKNVIVYSIGKFHVEEKALKAYQRAPIKERRKLI